MVSIIRVNCSGVSTDGIGISQAQELSVHHTKKEKGGRSRAARKNKM
jgi:hypothetical protein